MSQIHDSGHCCVSCDSGSPLSLPLAPGDNKTLTGVSLRFIVMDDRHIPWKEETCPEHPLLLNISKRLTFSFGQLAELPKCPLKYDCSTPSSLCLFSRPAVSSDRGVFCSIYCSRDDICLYSPLTTAQVTNARSGLRNMLCMRPFGDAPAVHYKFEFRRPLRALVTCAVVSGEYKHMSSREQ